MNKYIEFNIPHQDVSEIGNVDQFLNSYFPEFGREVVKDFLESGSSLYYWLNLTAEINPCCSVVQICVSEQEPKQPANVEYVITGILNLGNETGSAVLSLLDIHVVGKVSFKGFDISEEVYVLPAFDIFTRSSAEGLEKRIYIKLFVLSKETKEEILQNCLCSFDIVSLEDMPWWFEHI
jgi:hypothetical protein